MNGPRVPDCGEQVGFWLLVCLLTNQCAVPADPDGCASGGWREQTVRQARHPTLAEQVFSYH